MAISRKPDIKNVDGLNGFIQQGAADIKPQPEPKKKEKEPEELIQRSYYLTPKQIKAIALKAAKTGRDKSELVRAAIEKYCADELKEL